MNWFSKILPPKIKPGGKKSVPEGLWISCSACKEVLFRQELNQNDGVCPKCSHHHRLSAVRRIKSFLDEEGVETVTDALKPVDVLKFRDSKKYKDRLADAQKKTGIADALVVKSGTLIDRSVVVAAFEFEFIGGSMGSVVGEQFVRAVDTSIQHRSPFVCFSASGGARMQEAMFSLMQMAKTTAAISKLREERIPYISVLTDPTLGGVSASLAMLGDIIIAEPNAVIGFAGPRVIEQTVRESLPEGFQRSEFLLRHGAIDMVIDRRQMRTTIHRLLWTLQHTNSSAD